MAKISDADGIEWFERNFGVPLGDKPGERDTDRVRASAGISQPESLERLRGWFGDGEDS